MVEHSRVQDARLWFNVTWQSVPNAVMSSRCQVRMSAHIPIIKSINTIVTTHLKLAIYTTASIPQQNTEKREKLH